MNRLIGPNYLLPSIQKANVSSPSVMGKIIELENSPSSLSIKIEVSGLSDFYVNAGKFCILFNYNEEEEKIEIINIVRSALLHKIQSGWVVPTAE